jgi:hypothetical protein
MRFSKKNSSAFVTVYEEKYSIAMTVQKTLLLLRLGGDFARYLNLIRWLSLSKKNMCTTALDYDYMNTTSIKITFIDTYETRRKI